MFDNLVPFSNIHELNLDWIIAKVKEYIIKFDDLDEFVNKTVDEQNAIISKAVEDLAEGFDDLKDYITANLRVIANEIINELVESGELYIGTEYNSETEELQIVLTKEE